MRFASIFALLTIVLGMDPNAHNINSMGKVWNCTQSYFVHPIHQHDLMDFLNSHKPTTMPSPFSDLNSNIPGSASEAPVIQRPTITPNWR